MREKHCSLQQAIDCMSDHFIVVKNEFLQLVKEVPSFGPSFDPQVQEYLDGV